MRILCAILALTVHVAKNAQGAQGEQLGQTVVFPAAGYLAVAVEAFRQLMGPDRCSDRILAFRQVKFLKALALLDENHGVEILTELRPQQISGTTESGMCEMS